MVRETRMNGTKRSRAADGLEGEVDSPEALAFQRRSWAVERAAWLVMGLVVIAGLLGLFGGGPLGSRVLRGDGVELRYDALTRLGTPQVLELRVAPAGGLARVTLASGYLARVRLDDVWPTPEKVEAAGEWTTLTFASRDPAPVHVRIAFSPERPGLLEGRVQADGGGALTFRQLVYP
jgi:hypothetical protein